MYNQQSNDQRHRSKKPADNWYGDSSFQKQTFQPSYQPQPFRHPAHSFRQQAHSFRQQTQPYHPEQFGGPQHRALLNYGAYPNYSTGGQNDYWGQTKQYLPPNAANMYQYGFPRNQFGNSYGGPYGDYPRNQYGSNVPSNQYGVNSYSANQANQSSAKQNYREKKQPNRYNETNDTREETIQNGDNENDHEDLSDYDCEYEAGEKERDSNGSHVTVDSDNDVDDFNDSKRRCSNTYYNSNISKDDKSSPGRQNLKITSATEALSPNFILTYLNRIFDFLRDETRSMMVFEEITDQVESNFLFNIKSKKIIKKLNPECKEIYSRIKYLHTECKLSWQIRWRKINGMKVPEYTKSAPRKRNRAELLEKINSKYNKTTVTPEFIYRSLKTTLDFLEDDSQASVIFTDVTDSDQNQFLYSLRSLQEKHVNPESWKLFKRIAKISRDWEPTSRTFNNRRIIEFYKRPPTSDNNSIKSDNSEGKKSRSRFRKRSRTKNKDKIKDLDDNRSKKDNSISFIPQNEKDPDPKTESEQKDTESNVQKETPKRVSREKAKILEGLAKPVVADNAERMMMMMGWNGGALGSKGDGIMEPLAPNLLQVSGAGLGHVKDDKADGPKDGGRRVNKEKAKILEGLATPVVASKAERMMMMMGWNGGALGSKGDGIVEPLAPNLLQVSGAGLGHVRDASPKNRPSRRQTKNKMDDFEIGVWEPVKMTKRQMRVAHVPKKMKKKMQRSALKTTALKRILDFVSDDRQLEMSFEANLNGGQRKIVHAIVNSLSEGIDYSLFSAEQAVILRNIEKMMDCVLYTESSGDQKAGTRQLFIYKTVSNDTYMITPDDLEFGAVEPSQLIDEDSNDCIIVEPENKNHFEKQTSNKDDNERNSDHTQRDSDCIRKGADMRKDTDMRKDVNQIRNETSMTEDDLIAKDTGHIRKNDVMAKDIDMRNDNMPNMCTDNSKNMDCIDLEKDIENLETIGTYRVESDEDIDTGLTFNTYPCPDNEDKKFSITIEEGGKISGISILRLKHMERKPVLECPTNSACKKFQLCRAFLPNDGNSSSASSEPTKNWFAGANEYVCDSSDESVEVANVRGNRLRKRPHCSRASKTDAKEVDLIEIKMKTIGLPKLTESDVGNSGTHLTRQERITKLLVTYFVEFFEDKDSVKLRFLGDFKVVDRIIINWFMNEIKTCLTEASVERLMFSFGQDKGCFNTLKRVLFEEAQKIYIERKDEGPFSTYTAFKTMTNNSLPHTKR